MKTRFSHAAAFGATSAIAVIAFSLLIYLTELNQALNNLSYVILIAILCIGVKKWREQSGGYLTFGGAYKHLILQSLVYTCIMTIWTYVFMTVIAPGLIEDQMLIQQAKMEDQGMAAEQVEIAMHYARMFTQPGIVAVFVFFGGMAIYAIVNLILAAIMKKDPPAEQFMPPGDFSNAPFPNMPPQNNPYGNVPPSNSPYGNNPPSNFPPQQ